MPVLTPDGRLLAVLDVDSGGRRLLPASAWLFTRTCRLLAHAPRPTLAAAPAAPFADLPAAFTEVDAQWLEKLCGSLGARPWQHGL